jgi:hypothetical protein
LLSIFNFRRYIMIATVGNNASIVKLLLKRGVAVQVDPIKPTSKSTQTKRTKLKHDELLLSSVALICLNLSR